MGGIGGSKASDPLLSILIPVYNVKEFLYPCLDSILAQALEGVIEVHLLDDMSTDGSREALIALASTDIPHLTVHLRAENGGVSAARNDLLAVARGQYFLFIDSDDLILPGTLERLVEILLRYQPDMLVFDYEKKGRLINGFSGISDMLVHDRDALVRGIFESRMMHAWLRVAHRRLWEEGVCYPEGKIYEDVAITPLLALRADSFYYLPIPVVHYRFRENSIMEAVRKGRFDKIRHDDFVSALDTLMPEINTRLPDVANETLVAIALFITREISKISYRLVRSKILRGQFQLILSLMRGYRAALEARSPLSVASIACYYRRRHMWRSYLLTSCIEFCSRSRGL